MLKPLAVGVGIGTAIGLVASRHPHAAALVRERAARLGADGPKQGASKLRSPDEREPNDLADLANLRKEDLYRRAQEAGIPGRSQMSKDELIAALRSGRG